MELYIGATWRIRLNYLHGRGYVACGYIAVATSYAFITARGYYLLYS